MPLSAQDLRLLAVSIQREDGLLDRVTDICSGARHDDASSTATALAEFLRTRAGPGEIQSLLQQVRGAAAVWRASSPPAELCVTVPPLLQRGRTFGAFPSTEMAMLDVILHAEKSLRLAFPFIDKASTEIMRQLSFAWHRGCAVQLMCRDRETLRQVIVDKPFLQALSGRRNGAACCAPTASGDESWTFHAKVLIADSRRAYAGSANLTRSSLSDQAELGVLTSDVRLIKELDLWYQLIWSAMSVNDERIQESKATL